MSLVKALRNIQKQIENKELENQAETNLKRYIWRILTELSWPGKGKDMRDEYSLSIGDRPDLALFRPNNEELLVLIELKTSGLTRLKKSKEQVKRYYSNSAVPLVVLTDVKTWMFYYKGKLAFEIGFSSQTPEQLSKELKKFLRQDNVYKGDAYRYAAGKLDEKDNLAKARKEIPAAWREIVKESNPLRKRLINELRERAGHALGVQDLLEADIVVFLQSLESRNKSKNTRQPRSKSERERPLSPSSVSPGRKVAATKAVKDYPGILVRGNKKPQSKGLPHELLQVFFTGKNARRKLTYDEAVRIGIEGGHDANRVKWQLRHNLLKRDYIRFDEQAQGNGKREENREITAPRAGELVILGKSFPCKNPTDAMVTVFKELERRERGFYQRFYNDRRNHGRMRRIIAQGAMRLYDSDNPRYAKYYKQLGGGWVIATYNNKKTIEKNIRIAAEVARLRFGKDIIVNFDDSLQSQERQGSPLPLSGVSGRKQSAPRRGRRASASGSARGRRVKVVIDGKPSSWQDQSDAMATVFKKLQQRDRSFCQQFYEHSQNQRKRGGGGQYLARNLVELFGDPLSKRLRRKISDGWVISTHYGWEVAGSKSSKKEIIRLAATVAGLEFKEDISGNGIIVNLDTY